MLSLTASLRCDIVYARSLVITASTAAAKGVMPTTMTRFGQDRLARMTLAANIYYKEEKR
jgi:hypothetical protein